jgi:hypothetical protein
LRHTPGEWCGELVTIDERRAAALANQRAAAFIRFQMLGDHQAMHILLSELEDGSQLSFVTALASIAGSAQTQAMGKEKALRYLQVVAEQSAILAGNQN